MNRALLALVKYLKNSCDLFYDELRSSLWSSVMPAFRPVQIPLFFWINKFGRLFSLNYLSFNLKKGNWDSLSTYYVEIPGKNNLRYFRRVLAFSFIFSLLVLCLLHAAFIWDNHWSHCKFYCHLANLWDGKGKTHFELN